MARFKFTTKHGTKVSACETLNEANAWKWIAQIKRLSIDQAKNLYNIIKLK